MLDELIEALTIFRKYGNPVCPTHCEHDTLYICGICASDVSQEDIDELDRLGFFVGDEDDMFISYKFGRA